MSRDFSAAGAVVGSVVGAATRASVVCWFIGRNREYLHYHSLEGGAALVLLVALLIGALVGLVAGSLGRFVVGAFVGALLGAVVSVLANIPVGWVFCVVSMAPGDPVPDLGSLLVPMGLAGAIAGVAGGGARIVRDTWKTRSNPDKSPVTRTMREKLVATVIRIGDLGVRLAEGRSEEQIELDIKIQQGELSTAKRLQLLGPGYRDKIEFRSVDPFRSPDAPPAWARIICSRPRSLTVPTGNLSGWTVTES